MTGSTVAVYIPVGGGIFLLNLFIVLYNPIDKCVDCGLVAVFAVER